MAAGRGMRPFMKLLPVLLACASLAAAVDSEVWTFDRLDRVGGHPTTVVGEPRVVDTPVGKAIEFDGVDDALFVGVHPLAGAQTFTWEAIFRPDGGQPEQRWFHLQESGTENRLLFEIRVIDGRWCLDSYGHSGDAQSAIADLSVLRPDLILIDISLNSGTGFDVLKALQERNPVPPAIKVVLTNYASAEYESLSFSMGANGFFNKASDTSQVLALIDALASEKRRRRSLPSDSDHHDPGNHSRK